MPSKCRIFGIPEAEGQVAAAFCRFGREAGSIEGRQFFEWKNAQSVYWDDSGGVHSAALSEFGVLSSDDPTNITKMEFDCRPGATAVSSALQDQREQIEASGQIVKREIEAPELSAPRGAIEFQCLTRFTHAAINASFLRPVL